MPAIAKVPRLHACVRAPGAHKISPCIGALRVQGNEHMDHRATLRRCCMVQIPLTVHRHKGEAPCPRAPHKRSHNGGLATKAQRAPSSHANIHALGAPPTAGVEHRAQRRKIQAMLPQKRSATRPHRFATLILPPLACPDVALYRQRGGYFPQSARHKGEA